MPRSSNELMKPLVKGGTEGSSLSRVEKIATEGETSIRKSVRRGKRYHRAAGRKGVKRKGKERVESPPGSPERKKKKSTALNNVANPPAKAGTPPPQ